MASRKDQKERFRAEREERHHAEMIRAGNRRRRQLVAGVVLVIAAIAAVTAAIASSGGGDSSPKSAYVAAAIPARKTTDFAASVKAAGCVYKKYRSEGATHLASDTATNVTYKTNPPTSGNHRPTAAPDGVYAPGNAPEPFHFVHSLEHGRVELQYAPTASKRVRGQLQTLFNERLKGVAAYHLLLFQNNTNMPYEVAATAWTQMLGCKTVNDNTWDALRAFRERFTDKGPEIVP
jgi:hypothetical protein